MSPPAPRSAVPASAVALLLAIVLSACGGDPGDSGDPGTPGAPGASGGPAGATASAPTTTASSRTPTEASTSEPTPRPRPPLRGVDASHHQGDIDWAQVAAAGYRFAYLKASEGQTFTDPRFADNRTRAITAGLRVGGYHYFSLCSPGAAQAAHFLSVLGVSERGAQPTPALPPAVDLELGGNCDVPPPAEELLVEVEAFLATVEDALGVAPVVYLYPEFEEAFGFADDLADHRQWVRSLSGRPDRTWWMWQQSDSAEVPGISGPADVNLLRRRAG